MSASGSWARTWSAPWRVHSDSGQGNRAELTRPEAQVEAREILIPSDRDQSFG